MSFDLQALWEVFVKKYDETSKVVDGAIAAYVQSILQSTVLLNGGAIIALPAFLQWQQNADKDQVLIAGLSFVVGLVCSFIAGLFLVLVYVRLKWYLEARVHEETNKILAEIDDLSDAIKEMQKRRADSARGDRLESRGRFKKSMIASYALIWASIACFLNGVWQATVGLFY